MRKVSIQIRLIKYVSTITKFINADNMTKLKLSILLAMLSCVVSAYAQTFYFNGIKYGVLI